MMCLKSNAPAKIKIDKRKENKQNINSKYTRYTDSIHKSNTTTIYFYVSCMTSSL